VKTRPKQVSGSIPLAREY